MNPSAAPGLAEMPAHSVLSSPSTATSAETPGAFRPVNPMWASHRTSGIWVLAPVSNRSRTAAMVAAGSGVEIAISGVATRRAA